MRPHSVLHRFATADTYVSNVEPSERIIFLLGMMWKEPWYCYNDWEGGIAVLCRRTGNGAITGEVRTNTLKTWRKATVS